jgi:hypothetical protein
MKLTQEEMETMFQKISKVTNRPVAKRKPKDKNSAKTVYRAAGRAKRYMQSRTHA